MIEKSDLAEKVTAAEGGENVIAVIFQWKNNPYDAPADKEQLVAGIPPAKKCFARFERELDDAGLHERQAVHILKFPQQFDFSQPKRLVLPGLRPTMLIQDLILRPLHRLIQGQENLYVSAEFQKAELFEIGLEVLSRGERRQEMAEYEIALPLLQNVSKQLQHMDGGEIDGLYTPHVKDQKPAPLEVRFDFGKQLVRRAEKKAALQFGNGDQVPVLLQQLLFFLNPVLLGGYLVSVNFAPDDRAPDLLPDEQQDGQPHPHTCGGNEVEVNRSDHDQCDHAEIEYGGPLSQKEDAAKIDHSPSDHHQNSGEGGDGEPGNEPGQHQKGDQHKDPFQETGKSCPSAASNVHKGRPHCARPGHAPEHGGHDIRRTLAHQLAIGIVTAAGHGVHDHAGLQRVDREQHR